ncbi:MAG: MFS transporter, partial [Chloroflexota bacterium]
MLQNIKDTYQRFPKDFWILMLASFIDNVGGAILFPFFTIYVTSNFNVGMQEAGLLFTIFAVTHQFGSLIGGALTDRFGRKGMIIFGLVTSALASIWMGLVNELNLFYLGAAFAGLLASAGDPAQQAMVADLLPEEQRAEGYGIKRVVSNLAVTIGPLIGGLLASKS